MIQAVLLSNLGVAGLDGNGHDLVTGRDGATGLLWFVLIHAEPGGAVTGSIKRFDPGTMGRTLFHFRTTSCDGRHGLDYISMDGVLTTADLPALPALCAFVRTVRAEVEAERVPDMEALALLHLGVTLVVPPVEIRPGDRECRLWFDQPE